MSSTDNDYKRPRWGMWLFLAGVAGVFGWAANESFQEQILFAQHLGLVVPTALPVSLDGLAVVTAGMVWIASLDAHSAIGPRIGCMLAMGGSMVSNFTWAVVRGDDPSSAVWSLIAPAAAFASFEYLAGELRRQVRRSRGLAAPVTVPRPKFSRFVMYPIKSTKEWRQLVWIMTAPAIPEVSTSVAVEAVAEVKDRSDVGTISTHPLPQTFTEVPVETVPTSEPFAGEIPQKSIEDTQPVNPEEPREIEPVKTATQPKPRHNSVPAGSGPRRRTAEPKSDTKPAPPREQLLKEILPVLAEAEAEGRPRPGSRKVADLLGYDRYPVRAAIESLSTNGHSPNGES